MRSRRAITPPPARPSTTSRPSPSGGSSFPCYNNGYISTSVLDADHNTKTITTRDYQTGTLGTNYYPTSGTGLSQLINAGSRNNIIPEHASAQFNVRYRDKADLAKVEADFRKNAETTVIPDTKVAISSDPAFPPPQHSGWEKRRHHWIERNFGGHMEHAD